MFTKPRGNALPTAMITAVILAVVAVGILRFASRASLGASAAANEQALLACAEAARLQLASTANALANPASLQPLNVKIGSVSGAAPQALGGHYDNTITNVVFDQFAILPPQAGGPQKYLRDLTSISTKSAPMQPTKMVVHCQTADGRQLEVEFGVRMGL